MIKQSQKTELEKRDVLRMSNEESNRLTRECLGTALICLMGEKPFEKITITELVKRSGVSRTAFYRNYRRKEDILWEMNDAFMESLAKSFTAVRNHRDSYQWYHDFFQTIYDNADEMRLILQANLPIERLFSPDFIIRRLSLSLDRSEYYHFLAWQGAFSAVLINWFQEGMRENVDDMARLCHHLMKEIPVPEEIRFESETARRHGLTQENTP